MDPVLRRRESRSEISQNQQEGRGPQGPERAGGREARGELVAPTRTAVGAFLEEYSAGLRLRSPAKAWKTDTGRVRMFFARADVRTLEQATPVLVSQALEQGLRNGWSSVAVFISGVHVAGSLTLVVMHELGSRLRAKGLVLEWEDVKRDLEALSEVEVFEGESVYWLRTESAGCASKVVGLLGIAAPPTVRGLSLGNPRLTGPRPRV